VSWSLHRWVWRLESPLFIGMPPSGSLNRCRMYVPARNVWAAVTAELAQGRAHGFPDYAKVGQGLADELRFTYLYPAQRDAGSDWRAWLPRYETGAGLVWRREDRADGAVPDRAMRARVLGARPGTAIDPDSSTAADGSLRETECLETRWRNPDGSMGGPVGLMGYVFVRDGARTFGEDDLRKLDVLFLGGDTRYGLGRVRRADLREMRGGELFGARTTTGAGDPPVVSRTVFSHARAPGGTSLTGALEQLAGWDRAAGTGLTSLGGEPLWMPGSILPGVSSGPRWRIARDGVWVLAESPA
jgi:hypothetical protein